MTDYDVYPDQPSSSAETAPGAHVEQWRVLVEFSNRGEAKPPTKLVFAPDTYPTREAAMVEAEHRAFTYDPPDPLSQQGRQVFRDGDGFLTVIKGAMSTFHFRTRLVRYLGDGTT